MVNLALSAFVLRSTTKNTGRQLFEGKKCHLPPPREKILATPMVKPRVQGSRPMLS